MKLKNLMHWKWETKTLNANRAAFLRWQIWLCPTHFLKKSSRASALAPQAGSMVREEFSLANNIIFFHRFWITLFQFLFHIYLPNAVAMTTKDKSEQPTFNTIVNSSLSLVLSYTWCSTIHKIYSSPGGIQVVPPRVRSSTCTGQIKGPWAIMD